MTESIEDSPAVAQSKDGPEAGGFDSESKFTVYFDGEAHRDHKIDIGMLANALSALSSVLHDSAKLVTGDANDINIEVSENFKAGSFGVEIAVMFSDSQIVEILKAFGFAIVAGGVTGTVLETLHFLKGKTIDVIETDKDGTTEIVYDGQRLAVEPMVATLVSNPRIRSGIKKLIADPLAVPGTDVVKVTVPREPESQIVDEEEQEEDVTVFQAFEADADSFCTLQATPQSTSSNEEVRIKFLSANIDKNSGWRIQMPDGVTTYKVKMADNVFVERLKIMEEPHIFGREFPVQLETVVTTKLGVSRTSRIINNVRATT